MSKNNTTCSCASNHSSWAAQYLRALEAPSGRLTTGHAGPRLCDTAMASSSPSVMTTRVLNLPLFWSACFM